MHAAQTHFPPNASASTTHYNSIFPFQHFSTFSQRLRNGWLEMQAQLKWWLLLLSSNTMALPFLSAPTGVLELSSAQLKERLYSATGPFEGHFTMERKRTGPGANWVDPAAVAVEHELLGGEAGGASSGLRSWRPGATIKLAGDHRASLKVLQVEFRCTSEGTRCSKRCGCPVLQCLAPGGQRNAVTCCCGAGPFFSAEEKEEHRAEAGREAWGCCSRSRANSGQSPHLCPVRETFVVHARDTKVFVRVNLLSLEHAAHTLSPAKKPRRMPPGDKGAAALVAASTGLPGARLVDSVARPR